MTSVFLGSSTLAAIPMTLRVFAGHGDRLLASAVSFFNGVGVVDLAQRLGAAPGGGDFAVRVAGDTWLVSTSSAEAASQVQKILGGEFG